MPECAENLILEHLAPMQVPVDRVEQRLDDTTIRIAYLEASCAHEQSVRSTVSRQGSHGSKKGLNWPTRKVPG